MASTGEIVCCFRKQQRLKRTFKSTYRHTKKKIVLKIRDKEKNKYYSGI